MKAKTINAVISKKMGAWFESIEDEQVRKLAQANTIVTGGCIASMLLNESVNDFDLYFRTKEATEAIAKYYIDRFHPTNRNGIECKIWLETTDDRIKVMIKSAGIASEDGTEKAYEYFEAQEEGQAGEYVGEIMNDPGEIEDVYQETEEKALRVESEEKGRHRPVFMSTNAITLSGKIQLVLRFFGEPEEIHKNYDFVHCTNYWTSWDKKITLHQGALESLLARELVYVGSKYPVCSVFRLRKFIRRGWTINAGQILKMAMQISALDLTSVEVLQDQLTGVDCAYFCEVMTKVKDKDPEKISYAYLVEVLERMF